MERFHRCRATLARWQVAPPSATREEVESSGLRAREILNSEDALESMVRYCADHPPDLLVLAIHQRDCLNRWLHRAVAESLARRSRAMTLFGPTHGRGFVSPADGAVKLNKILVPVDHEPNAQAALEEVFFSPKVWVAAMSSSSYSRSAPAQVCRRYFCRTIPVIDGKNAW